MVALDNKIEQAMVSSINLVVPIPKTGYLLSTSGVQESKGDPQRLTTSFLAA